MKRSGVGWALAGLIAILALFSVLFATNQNGTPVGKPASGSPSPGAAAAGGSTPSARPSASPKDILGTASTFRGRDKEGRLTYEVHAATLTMRDVEKRTEAQKLDATFFSKDGKPAAHLVAAGATLNNQNENLMFHGPVYVDTPQGDTMTAQKMVYDGTKKKFFGSNGIKITRGTSILTGDRMVGDPNLRTVTILGNVQAFVHTLAQTTSPGSTSSPGTGASAAVTGPGAGVPLKSDITTPATPPGTPGAPSQSPWGG